MLVPACGTSSPVSFATSARCSCRRPESAAAALLSPVSTAARNSPNSGPRIAFKASVTPAPSSSRMRRVSPSRCNSLVASAARISAVRCVCACRQTASRETPKNAPPRPASKAPWRLRDRSAAAPGDCKSCSAAQRSASSENSHKIVAALRGARAAMSANSLRCPCSRRERKQQKLKHQNRLKKIIAKSWRGGHAPDDCK